jgi:hypothetical protein
MVMALLFILIVTAVSTLTLGILLAQALPYRSNSQKTQANYAAETGLQAALSFLRAADTTGGSVATLKSALFPSSSSTQSAVLNTSSVGAVQTVGAVKVDPASASGVASYTPDDVYYRLTVTYYDGDPTQSSSKVITASDVSADASKVASIKYAVVVSGGYVNSTSVATKSLSGIYQFGWSKTTSSGSSGVSGSTTFYGQALTINSNNKEAWIYAESYDAATGVLIANNNTRRDWWKVQNNPSGATGLIVQDPRYQTCMVAATDTTTGNVDPTKDATEDSPVRLFRVATSTDNNGTITITYSDQCKSTGAYKHLNTWIYSADDSIRLAGTDLCVTGEGNTVNMPAKLEKCGTGYSPKVNGAAAYEATYATKEARDAGSLLNKNQKWAFYYGFMNARDDVKDSNSKTLYQTLFGYRGPYNNFKAGGASGEYPGTCDTGAGEQFSDGSKACYLISTKWQNPRIMNGWLDNKNSFYTGSLGMAGESGYETKQIVSSTGYCIDGRQDRNTNRLTTLPCNVDAEPLHPSCDYTECSTGWHWISQTINYVEAASATDTTAHKTPALTTLSSMSYWNDQPKESFCYKIERSPGPKAQKVLKVYGNGGACPTASSTDSTHSFYRFGYVGEGSKFNYKFVLASTVDPTAPDSSSNPQCLTQMSADDPDFDFNYYWYDPTMPYVALKSCSASSTNIYGQTTYPQEWNTASGYSHSSGSGSGGSSGSSGTSMTAGTGSFIVTKQLS